MHSGSTVAAANQMMASNPGDEEVLTPGELFSIAADASDDEDETQLSQ